MRFLDPEHQGTAPKCSGFKWTWTSQSPCQKKSKNFVRLISGKLKRTQIPFVSHRHLLLTMIRSGVGTRTPDLLLLKGTEMEESFVYKALLLDERELESICGHEIKNFGEIPELVPILVRAKLGERDDLRVAHFGLCSERFERSHLAYYDEGTNWVGDGRSWRETISEICMDLGRLDQPIIERFLDSGDQNHLMSEVTQLINQDLGEEGFWRISKLVAAVENLRRAGLPCFSCKSGLLRDGTVGAYDIRNMDYGAGRRVLVETAFVWE